MAMNIKISRNNYKLLVIFLAFLSISLSLTQDKKAFLYGIFVSLANLGVYYYFYFRHKNKIPEYQGQALVVVVISIVTRFILIGGLLVWGLTQFSESESLLLGFVLGQLFFLFNQLLTVAITDGK